ncbi:MAG: DnaD domain protein [Clostridia bacterium]|nr:DnaD domain protein [Clostridia bacterium]
MLVNGFTKGSSMFDVTPVENMFITEYMMRAPGDYVKVYLFLLNICYYPHDDYTTGDVAKELGMDEDDVKKAIIYWAQLSLIEIESRRPFSLRVRNIKQMLQNDAPQKVSMHSNQELVMQIQQSFGGRRLLNAFETQKVLNWADVFKWSPEMIALVVSWCVDKKGARVSVSYIDKVISTMYEREVDSYEKAENYLMESSAWESGATKLLKAFNEGRVATVDEIKMYKKWTDRYEMDEAVIKEARKQTIGISGNKFKYMDGILTNWNKKGIRTYTQIQEHLDSAERLKEIAKIIYGSSVYDEKVENEYTEIRKMGFSHKVLLRVAIALKGDGLKAIADMHKVINKWAADGVTDDDAMMDKLDSIAQNAVAANEMMAAAGEARSANVFEKKAYARWIGEGRSNEEILDAARKAAGAEKKISYINAILSSASGSVKASAKNRADIGIISHDYTDKDYQDILSAMEEM